MLSCYGQKNVQVDNKKIEFLDSSALILSPDIRNRWKAYIQNPENI